ncbi:hypothetical protein [Aurantibacillus circumpalustris]|uniref:hypothetical protein n=1 Tax=Aurantibacillus circumpalustris TaxID=3036359 RepID=UPI00295C3168|nr:hypothetical protein [Aurantibacillus circumpalustris]
MTEKKINFALGRIKACKTNKCPLEALIRSYHLNIDLLKFIFVRAVPGYELENKKVKVIVAEFLKELDNNMALKTFINKRSIKSLKPWLSKMDLFFKSLKLGQQKNIASLQDETEKIFGILKISTNKLFVKK